MGGCAGYAVPHLLRLDQANRHGLSAGATGPGKTATEQVLAEGIGAASVPVLLPDVEGDLSGLSLSRAPLRPAPTPSLPGAPARSRSTGFEAGGPLDDRGFGSSGIAGIEGFEDLLPGGGRLAAHVAE